MTNEQRVRVDRLERYLIADKINLYVTVRTDDLDTVLTLIKGSQTEIEIYKEELDSIYKALDIERGVARPRTYEIIQVLKNTIKSQAKQIENTKALYDRALSDLVKADKQIDLMADIFYKRLKAELLLEYGFESKEELKQYFERKVENDQRSKSNNQEGHKEV